MIKQLVRSAWKAQPRWLRMRELDALQAVLSRPLDPNRPLRKGDAVIVGFLGTASGLGQCARQMLELMKAKGLPVQGANASRFAVLEDMEAGPLWPQEAQEGGVAIFQINPDLFSLIAGAIGPRRLQSRRIVGIWAWELEKLPAAWHRTLRLVDEVWAPSHFVADAVRAAAPDKPVYVIPPFMDVADYPTAPSADPLPQFAGRTVVFFMYDVRSVHARKNPEAVITAFRQATGNDPNPLLVIKVNNPHAWPEAMAQLERVRGGAANIHIMTEKLSGKDMKDLMARANVVMSLHRSEGFGFLMAEAMAAAKPVIATGWSSNLDFMPRDCTVLIDYRLIPVVDPQHIYDHTGARWADADVGQAAVALRRLLDDPAERTRMGKAARAHIAEIFSADKVVAALPKSFWLAIGQEKGVKSEL